MSKKTRQLIIALAVVVVIAAVVTVLCLLPGNGSDSTSSAGSSSTAASSGEEVTLYDRDEKDIESITVKNDNGEFVFKPTTKTESDGTIDFAVEGYENLNVSNSVVSGIAQFGQKLRILKEIGETDRLADYGLTDPAARYTVKYKDGSSVTVLLGSTLNSNANQRYAVEEGKKTVYAVSADAMVNVRSTTLLSTTLISAATTNQSSGEATCPTFGYIRISGRDHEDPIEIYPTSQLTMDATSPLKMFTYYIDGKTKLPLYSSATEKYLLDMCTVTATDIAAVNPTEAQLKEYGMDDPIVLRFQTVETDSDNKETKTEYNLKVGTIDEQNQTAYAMIDGVNVVYVVGMSKLSVLTMSAYDMRDTLLYIVNADSVETFELDMNGQHYEFDHERTERVSSSSSQASSGTASSVVYDYTTYYNGEELTMFSKFYQQFLSAYKQEPFTDLDSKGDLLFTLTLKHYPECEKKETVFKVYQCATNDRRVVFEVDGEIQGLVKSTWASACMDAVDKLLKGEEITVVN